MRDQVLMQKVQILEKFGIFDPNHSLLPILLATIYEPSRLDRANNFIHEPNIRYSLQQIAKMRYRYHTYPPASFVPPRASPSHR